MCIMYHALQNHAQRYENYNPGQKTHGRCFFMADDYISWMLSSTKWLHPSPPPPPPGYNVAVSNVNKVIIMSRGFTNIVPGGGGGGRIYGGYFRDCATLFVFNVFVRVILSMIVAPYDCSSSETAEYDQKFIVSSGIRNGVLKN